MEGYQIDTRFFKFDVQNFHTDKIPSRIVKSKQEFFEKINFQVSAERDLASDTVIRLSEMKI